MEMEKVAVLPVPDWALGGTEEQRKGQRVGQRQDYK